MAVEHKDDNQPITNKLKALQEGENAESNNTDNKENLQENGNNNTNTNQNNQDTTKDNTQTNEDNNKNTNNNNNEDDNNNNNNNENNDNENDENENTNTDNNDNDEDGVEAGIAALNIAEPSNFTVKHPLQNSWTIWYDNPGKRSNQASWGDHLKKITTFSFVEDFWRVFNNLKPASALAQGSNYHIFKEFIEPKWEDSQNSKGGKWTVSIPPKSRNSSLDQMWLWTVLAVIGETFDSPDDVCGLVVSVRKAGDRVQIWTKDATNEQACRDIGRSLKSNLDLPDNIIIGYQSHADSMKKASKNRYEV